MLQACDAESGGNSRVAVTDGGEYRAGFAASMMCVRFANDLMVSQDGQVPTGVQWSGQIDWENDIASSRHHRQRFLHAARTNATIYALYLVFGVLHCGSMLVVSDDTCVGDDMLELALCRR